MGRIEAGELRLTDFYTQEELDKWGMVVLKEIWHRYHEDKPKVSDAIGMGDDNYLQIFEMKEDDKAYFFKLHKVGDYGD